MTPHRTRQFHDGATQGLAAMAAGIVTASIIASSASSGDPLTGRLAILGVVLFAVALALGSARIVGVTSLPVLGSALASSATADNPAWVQSIIVGCLWYVAVELAWDSIERRDGARRAIALDLRRINEVASVVFIALAVTATAYAASSFDLSRTLVRQVVLVVALIAALVLAIRHVVATSPVSAGEQNGL